MPTHDVYATPQAQPQTIDFNNPYQYKGYEVQFDTPERRYANQQMAMNGVNGSAGADPYAMPALPQEYLRSLGYQGPTDVGSYGEAGSGYQTAPELYQWLADNGYAYGMGGQGTERISGLFDKYGQPVSPLHEGTEKGDFLKAMAPVGMFVGAGALGLGTGGASTLGSEFAGNAAVQAGLNGSAIAPELASGLTPEELQQVQNLSTTAGSEGGELGAANGSWDVLPEATQSPAPYAGTGGAPGAGYGTGAGAGTAASNPLSSVGDWLGNVWNGNPAALNQLRMITGGLGLLGSLIPKKQPTVNDLKGQVKGPYDNWTPAQSASMAQFNTNRPFVYKPPKLAGGGPVHSQPCGCPMCSGGMVQGYAAGGQADNVPINASPGEYVMDADVVSALGDGDNDAGAAALDKMRERIRAHKRSAPPSKIPPKALSPLEYLTKHKGR